MERKKEMTEKIKKGRTKKKMAASFHLRLKHILGGVSLLSLLAAFEVFSIPAASRLIDIFGFTRLIAGVTWIGVALFSGGVALYLHEEE
ncbi:hypothetical protein [Caldiplasma sukawensis]